MTDGIPVGKRSIALCFRPVYIGLLGCQRSDSHAAQPLVEPCDPPAGSQNQASPTELKDPALYINRELSWLAFNQRVLDQARDPSHPVLERVKFLAISGANLDEFFMIRVATTLKKLREGLEAPGPDGLTMSEQLTAMRRTAYAQVFEQAACWDDLRPLLTDHGIRFLDSEAWTPAIDAHLSAYFARQVAPVLTPLAFDPGHPFPLISNLSKNLAVVVRHDGRTKFARVKIPDVLRRFIALPPSLSAEPGTTFVFLEDVVRANLPALFPGVEILSAHLFRVIRDSDLELEQGDADDLLETVDRSLRQLRRGAISLVKVDADMPQRVLDILTDNFEVGSDVMFKAPRRLGLADWWQIARLPRPELKYAPMQAPWVWRPHEDPEVIFEQLRFGDVVVHHPYESFATVEAFVRAAVRDPHVVAIKMKIGRAHV